MLDERLPYALVHLISQECHKDLIESQVMDSMELQVTTPGLRRPSIVAVGLLEAARHAISRRMRSRIKVLRRRAPRVRIVLLPYSSRLPRRIVIEAIARRIRSITRDLPVVLHCRTEAAGEWGSSLLPRLRHSGMVLDVRGAWPEELVFSAGFDGIDAAPPDVRASAEHELDRLRGAEAASEAVLAVSPGLVEWLVEQGVRREKIRYVPCCVSGTTYREDARRDVRAQLGISERLLLVYSGTLAAYQHVRDGVLPFARLAMQQDSRVAFLGLSNTPDELEALAEAAGLPADRRIIRGVPQREVAAYLAAGDAGVLLRAPSRMNGWSQPTKFAEYLAAGLPVVVSEGTGVIPELVRRRGGGLVVRWFGADHATRAAEVAGMIDALTAEGEMLRRSAINLCESHFTWPGYVDVLREVYASTVDRESLRLKVEGGGVPQEHSERYP